MTRNGRAGALNKASSDVRAYRLVCIDLLRGLVIVIMVLDHVRDYLFLGAVQDPIRNPNISLALYLTRWITHFCAPTFIFLAGVSAGLMTARMSPGELCRFLVTRGIWLVIVDAVVITTAQTFTLGGTAALDGRHFVILQVMWAIGVSMVALGIAQMLGRRFCLWLGLGIVAAHNLLDPIWPANAVATIGQPFWVVLHAQMSYVIGNIQLRMVYPVLPWVGVMLTGFGAALIFTLPPMRRDRLLRWIGLAMIAGFIALRALDIYGDPRPWIGHAEGLVATARDFFNTTKYPPSLLFLLMTLGPAAVACSYIERLGGALREVLLTFGRVPFAAYVLQYYVIHLLSVFLGLYQGFSLAQMLTNYLFYPQGYGIGLPGIYAVWTLVILILFPLCRRIAIVKASRRDWWLRYL